MQLIAFTGRKYSGKDTAANFLLNLGFKKVFFAAPLKGMLTEYLRYLGVDDDKIQRLIDGDLKETPTEYFMGQTPRYTMQTLGTEWARGMISDQIWLNAFKSRATQYDKVICSDCRFANEVEFIRELGGQVYRIKRTTNVNQFSNHASEIAIDDFDVPDILNDGTIEDLKAKVLALVSRS